ncbi:MAG: segregation/condensation protein A [Deltaproteobacteria bacterium]|nr:segregation/condensation protein A [Deltaproteobacteria bacterium]
MDYEVKLEVFEGPLDLLLHLIHKNEVDIFDIPITTITDQYLAYLDMMKALNISVAGDFLVMASTLIHIKSKMLLPGLNEGDEEEDPRDEITRPLLEYMRLKEMAGELSEREILGKDVFTRQDATWQQAEIDAEGPNLDVNLFQLIDAFRRIMEQNQPGANLMTIKKEKWSIKEKSQIIIAFLKEKGEILFHEIFRKDRTVPEFIVTFLALLELVHIGLVRVFQPSLGSDIHLVAHFDDNESTDSILSIE